MPNTLLFSALRNRFYSETDSALQRALANTLLIIGGSLLIAALAQVRIPLPGTPVPVTGQSLGVILIGLLLGSKRGTAAVAVYLTQGGLGLPFFAGGAAGFTYMAGVTGGYLIGFLAAAALVGWMAETKAADRKFLSCLPAVLLGHAVIFFFGALWLSQIVGIEKALFAGVLPFLPGAVIKTVALASLLPVAWKFVKKIEE